MLTLRRNKPFEVLIRSYAAGETVCGIEQRIAILLHVCRSLEKPESLSLLGAGNEQRDAVGRLYALCLMFILFHRTTKEIGSVPRLG